MTHSDYIKLVSKVKEYDYYYFELNAPMITDEEYDRLFFQLQDYEQQNPTLVLPDSPTQYAHGEVKNGHKQVRRRTPMLSTQKAQTVEAVEKWMKTTNKALSKLSPLTSHLSYTVEWKYDGVSVSLVYQDGKLIEASYGKGAEGNDCMALVKQIASVPQTISAAGRVEVRGEVVCPFANLSKTGYKNCRCAASGILADTQSTKGNLLEFYPYYTEGFVPEDFGCHNPEGVEMQSRFNALYVWGFEHNVMTLTDSIEDFSDCLPGYIREREDLPFPVDGLVIKVADCSQWELLGATAHHPKYSIAYKFAAETAETTVTRIEITTGKTGKRTPVAYFEPVVINGATYHKASVGSEAKLAELGIEVGSKVQVSLRNDVIPHIDCVLNANDESGENSGDSNSDDETENHHSITPKRNKVKSFLKKAGKVVGTMCVGTIALAGAATLLYCCVGLIFFLPLILAKR